MRLTFIFLILFSFSCGTSDDVDCSLATIGLPPSSSFFFKYENSQGELLLETTYIQDSFKVFNSQTEFYIQREPNIISDHGLRFNLFSIDQDDTYYIELNSQDTDTLIIGFTENVGPCFTFRNLTELSYNNDELYNFDTSPSQEQFTIIKE